MLLGEFRGDDKLIVWTSRNQYYTTGYDLAQHFPDETVRIEKYVPGRVYALCYFDREQGYHYMKRFVPEVSGRMLFFLDEAGQCDFVCMTSAAGARLRIEYGGTRPAEELDADGFIGVKSHRAKGKRLTTHPVERLEFLEPEPDAAAGGPQEETPPTGAAALEIERPQGDEATLIDPAQLNLF